MSFKVGDKKRVTVRKNYGEGREGEREREREREAQEEEELS